MCDDGGWGHNLAVRMRRQAVQEKAQELQNMQPGTLGWMKTGLNMTLTDIGAGAYGMFDTGTASGRLAGGDRSTGTYIGVAGDVLIFVSAGGEVYLRSLSDVIQGSGGPSTVYGLAEPQDKSIIEYIGQTTDEVAREGYWRSERPGLVFVPLARNLTPVEADGIEQLFIEARGGASGYSNGGSLLNKINNISPKNPYYSQAMDAAYRVLFK